MTHRQVTHPDSSQEAEGKASLMTANGPAPCSGDETGKVIHMPENPFGGLAIPETPIFKGSKAKSRTHLPGKAFQGGVPRLKAAQGA